MKWQAKPDADAEKAGQTQTSSIKTVKTHSRLSSLVRVRMKCLFMWVVLELYKEGSIVLYDRPLPLPSIALDNRLLSSSLFSSSGISSAKHVIPEEDAYLSDPPMYEEDEAYVPMTPALLVAPVQEIIRAMGIRGKSPKVRADNVMGHLKVLNVRWANIDLQAVEEAIQFID
jgi:hypothetical protein